MYSALNLLLKSFAHWKQDDIVAAAKIFSVLGISWNIYMYIYIND